MLVLTRKVGDSVILDTSDGPVEVLVVAVRGNAVRLGFEAPDSVRIHRAELGDRDLSNPSPERIGR